MGIPEIKQIERYLKYYSISMLDGKKGFQEQRFYYKGPANKYFIYILFTESHYNVIKSMKALLDVSYYCNFCKKGYNDNDDHTCSETCFCCKKQGCLKIGKNLKCLKCKQKARNSECLQFHNEYICKKKSVCDFCNDIIIKKKHVCINQKYCVNCKKVVSQEHLCYLQRDKFPKKDSLPLIFFDYECYQKNNKHIPNYIVAKKICVLCLKLEGSESDCKSCTQNEFVNNNDFCEWLFSQEEKCVAICHNFKGYDSAFVMEWILENMNTIDKKPTPLMNGSKILSIKFRKVKIIDSLSFLPMPLEKFSKTFDIKELKKGFFPHEFNKEENQNYIGSWPEQHYFGVKFMTSEKKEEFEKWHLSNCDKIYNFQEELKSYCRSDVDLLMKGCLIFRKNIIEITKREGDENFSNGIDAFCVSVTIASLCHFIFEEV